MKYKITMYTHDDSIIRTVDAKDILWKDKVILIESPDGTHHRYEDLDWGWIEVKKIGP